MPKVAGTAAQLLLFGVFYKFLTKIFLKSYLLVRQRSCVLKKFLYECNVGACRKKNHDCIWRNGLASLVANQIL